MIANMGFILKTSDEKIGTMQNAKGFVLKAHTFFARRSEHESDQ
jgi:hypothetical protein